MANAIKDERASYESSLWTKIGLLGNKFLGRTWIHDIDQDSNAVIAAYTALYKEEAGRFDINPREIIFHAGDRVISDSSRSGGPRWAGKHRRG